MRKGGAHARSSVRPHPKFARSHAIGACRPAARMCCAVRPLPPLGPLVVGLEIGHTAKRRVVPVQLPCARSSGAALRVGRARLNTRELAIVRIVLVAVLLGATNLAVSVAISPRVDVAQRRRRRGGRRLQGRRWRGQGRVAIIPFLVAIANGTDPCGVAFDVSCDS